MFEEEETEMAEGEDIFAVGIAEEKVDADALEDETESLAHCVREGHVDMEVFSVIGEIRYRFEEGRAVQARVECALKHFQVCTLGEARRGGRLVRVS